MLTEKRLSTTGHELKTRRELLGLSALDISKQMGVAPKCIVAIEEGNLGFFSGAQSEVERLIALYKRKLHLKASFLETDLITTTANGGRLFSEAGFS